MFYYRDKHTGTDVLFLKYKPTSAQ